MEFTGLPQEMLDFFMEIRLHNDISYFNEHRDRYERLVKGPLYALADALAPIVLKIDPRLDTRPLRAVSRMRRDTRFTKDKTPYRDHMWIGWRRLGEQRMTGVGFYWEISVEQTRWGCGVYSDQRELMAQMRGDMLERPAPYLAILDSLHLGEKFDLHGDTYKKLKVPEGLEPRLKDLYLSKGFYVSNVPQPGDFDLVFSGGIVDRLAVDYQMLAPMYELMREQEAIACPLPD